MAQSVGCGKERLDAPAKAMGQALYAADYTAEGMLHVALVRAEAAHAELLGLDTTALPEGAFLFTAADLPHNLLPSIMNDQPALAEGKIRFWGEPVAVVAADTPEAARAAAASVRVLLRELPVVEDAVSALAPGAPAVQEAGNLCGEFYSLVGDPDAAFSGCDLILEDSFSLPVQEHGFLEPEAAFTYRDDKGRLCLVSSTQNAFADRDMIAAVLALSPERIHSRAATIGGGFGGKDGNTAQIFPAIVTHFTGRPAKLVFTREESIRCGYKRHAAKVTVKMGLTREGILRAYEGKIWLDTGAYAALGPAVLGLGTEHLPGPYRIQNVRLSGWLCYTNNTPASAMRGFGAPQGAMATESLLNRAAAALSIDPIELRLRNALCEGDTGAIGQRMSHSVGLADALRQFAASDFYREMKEHPAPGCGYGVAAGMMSSGMGRGVPDTADVVIERTAEGFLCRVGLCDIGQGSETALAMIAADALSVPLSRIRMKMADTDETLACGSTAASRSIYIAGNALLEAAAKIHAGADRAEGHAAFPETELPGGIHTLYGFIVQGAKVTVDPITGAVSPLWVHNTTEAGRIINPVSMAGQIFGGIAMSAGYALSEEIRYRGGRSLEDSFASYTMPTALDAPRMTSDNVEYSEASGPCGAKGVAEASTVALAPAIASAVTSLAPAAHLTSLPLDRTEILRALSLRS